MHYLVPGPVPCPEVVAVFYIRLAKVPTPFSVEGDAQVKQKNHTVGLLTILVTLLITPPPPIHDGWILAYTRIPVLGWTEVVMNSDAMMDYLGTFDEQHVLTSGEVTGLS